MMNLLHSILTITPTKSDEVNMLWTAAIAALIPTSGIIIALINNRKRANKLEASVGIVNGHGTLMDQTAVLLDNQRQMQANQAVIQQNVFDVGNQLSDHIVKSYSELLILHSAVDKIKDSQQAVSDKVDSHIKWEQDVKYPELWAAALGHEVVVESDPPPSLVLKG